MGVVMSFRGRSEGELSEFLERAVILRKVVFDNGIDVSIDISTIERIFEGKISNVLINSKLIAKDFFLCGIYISKMLLYFIYYCPQSWYAIDYIEMAQKNKNPFYLKCGADMCFLLCSLFEERTNRKKRAISKKTYIEIGGRLYYMFFSETESDIGCYMSKNFEIMTDVTKEAVEDVI